MTSNLLYIVFREVKKMNRTRVRVDIMGRGFNLVSDEKSKYIEKVAKEVDRKMRELKNENPKLAYDTAAVLTALNFCDELLEEKLKKPSESEEKETNLIRSQLVEYSKELSKATNTIKKLEKELENMKNESKKAEEKLRREYEAKEKEMLDMLDSM